MSHFFFMSLYAALIALFFAGLWRRDRRGQVKLFLQIFLGLVGAAIALGWLMYAVPAGPPAPIP